MKILNVIDVARWRLCVGCGACEAVCPEIKIRMVDVVSDGLRPVWIDEIETGIHKNCLNCTVCLEICPGIETSNVDEECDVQGLPLLEKRWGKVLEVWEGYASDPEIRYRGSSGGLCTALSLFCLETGRAGGVLHAGADLDYPLKNKTFLSTAKDDLLLRTGSRYSPASPCDGIKRIESAEEKSVFVGKPCDVAGLSKVRRINPILDDKIDLAIGFFCAGTPSSRGTLDLLKKQGIMAEGVSDFRYRGMGWPGLTTVRCHASASIPLQLTYEESWGFIQKFRPFRCYLCPDLTAEFADIAVGDPWYRENRNEDPGRSLVLIRTPKGRAAFEQAMANNYVTAERADPIIIYRSQKNLLGKRQAIWGRLLAMRALGIPYPKLVGFHLFDNWLDLPLKEKVKSIFGTGRRIVQRNYFKSVQKVTTLR